MSDAVRAATAAASFCLLAVSGESATLCVHPSGAAGCETTIQAAIDRAGAGDLVRVGPGVYYENVVVPAGKDGLRITGLLRDATILDPSPFADRGIFGNGVGLELLSADVRVRNLRFRNGLVGVQVGGPGALLERLRFDGTDRGVFVLAAGAQVAHSEFNDNGDIGVRVGAPEALVHHNSFARSATAIWLDGGSDRSQARDNKVDGGTSGILVTANDVAVRGNRIDTQAFGALAAFGNNPVIEHNTVIGGNIGIVVSCTDSTPGPGQASNCGSASIASNTISGATDYGLLVLAAGRGMVVARNTLLNTGLGLSVNGEETTVEANRVAGVGGGGRNPHCFEAFGDITLRRNVARECGEDGFYLAGPGRIEGNRAIGTFGTGIRLDGIATEPVVGVEIVGNSALDNSAQGIAIVNGASQTRVTNNVAGGNRVDFCDEGIETIVAGNDFDTTGACEILPF